MKNISSLIAGIPLLLKGGAENSPDRVEINSGTELGRSKDYVTNAFTPRMDFRPLMAAESKLLTDINSSKGADSPETVAVWRLPESLYEGFKFVGEGISRSNRATVTENLLNHPDCRRAANKLHDFCKTAGFGNELKILGHFSRPPNTLTSGVENAGKYVGLHVDSFARGTVSTRSGFPTRLCINLGPEARYLMFANLSIKTIQDEFEGCGSDDPNELITQFMAANPNYPLIKIKINPGEAYIAPTEIIIHEGTSIGKKYFDAQLTLLGPFTEAAIETLDRVARSARNSSMTSAC